MRILKYIPLVCLPVWSSYVSEGQASFVAVKDHRFVIAGKSYYYIGANYWYGGLLANSVEGRRRVKRELDFLAARHINNLRVMAGAEGSGPINGVTRVAPALQPEQGRFNPDLLEGLDFLLSEMGKREMKAVVFLSNNWEWSGGFLQYLNWNGLLPDSVLPRKLNWDEQRDYVSSFYACEPCGQQYNRQVALVINRVNTITKKRYMDDPAIMAWEIANEPRPMRPAAIAAFEKWVRAAAAYIKQLDPHHLVTTGSEGEMGSETMDVFQAVHADANIDYCTIHIWPKNWGWFKDTAIARDLGHVIAQTDNYIRRHAAVARQLGKPLVIEEFGLPRDGHSYLLTSATSLRNRYYAGIFNQWKISRRMNDIIGGCNFWAFSGSGRPARGRIGWQTGDDLLGDPPQEEQGLNSVFDSDLSTWQLIESFSGVLPGREHRSTSN